MTKFQICHMRVQKKWQNGTGSTPNGLISAKTLPKRRAQELGIGVCHTRSAKKLQASLAVLTSSCSSSSPFPPPCGDTHAHAERRTQQHTRIDQLRGIQPKPIPPLTSPKICPAKAHSRHRRASSASVVMSVPHTSHPPCRSSCWGRRRIARASPQSRLPST